MLPAFRVEVKEAAKHSIMHRIDPKTKNDLDQNVDCTETEKP